MPQTNGTLADAAPVIQASRLSKGFPGVQALGAVDFDLRRGEVHALVGENGAGKSTLAKILAGLEQPDEGEILFKGKERRFRGVHEAMTAGVAMIHQELMPFPELTVAENIFIGREPTAGFPGWVSRRKLREQAQAILSRLGAAFDPEARLRDLSVAAMQMVEIAKAIACRAEVLIMDEPTSALSRHEADALFRLIRELQGDGIAVIYVSHKLDEVFSLAGRVTVLRDGRRISTDDIAALDRGTLVARMVGRELHEAMARPPVRAGKEAIAVCGLGRAGQFRNISFSARQGEIVGLTGLMGAGRTEVINAIYGLAPADCGDIRVQGETVRISSPRDAMAHGIGLVSEDRKQFGLVLNMSVKENLTLGNLRRCCRNGMIREETENGLADERIASFAIKAPNRDQKVKFLSGGNQQKIVIAKTLFAEPRIILLDEPTRGIDIGAKREVYGIISRLAEEGRTIIMVSSELDEIFALSDRILVMRGGAIAAEVDPGKSSPEDVLRHAMPG